MDFKEKASIFASRAADTAKNLAVSAARKTKQLSRIAKLNVDISNQRDAIKGMYAEMGKLYYETHKDDPEAYLQQLCAQVTEAMAAIADMEAEVTRLKTEDAAETDFEAVVAETEGEADIEVEIEISPEEEAPAPAPEPAPEPEPAPAPEPEPAPAPEPAQESAPAADE